MHLAKPYSPAVSQESRSHQPSNYQFNLYWKGGFGELHRHKYYLINSTIPFLLLYCFKSFTIYSSPILKNDALKSVSSTQSTILFINFLLEIDVFIIY